jgi:hypothetical protein
MNERRKSVGEGGRVARDAAFNERETKVSAMKVPKQCPLVLQVKLG